MNQPTIRARRPPLWLAASAVAAAWGALYSVARWIVYFAINPVHEDVRIDYVAAQAGLRYGWSTIYDLATLRALSAGFPKGETGLDASATYISPPLLAWLFVPLTAMSVPLAYVIWTLVSLAALVWAWHIAAPYRGLAKLTLLLLALALWPVMQSLYYGQPTILLLGLVATAWWLLAGNRPIAAGVALAIATGLKPQTVILVPLALLVSGRYRVFASWAAGSVLFAAAGIAALGPNGLVSFWNTLKYVQTDPSHTYFTIAYLISFGPLAYTLLALQGIAALAIAWRRRSDLDIVFAAGLLGSITIGVHLHQWDYSELVLAAWLVLRTSPPLWHRLFLLIGVATMQLASIGDPVPQLLWNAAWLAILYQGASRAAPEPDRRAVSLEASSPS
ncbi:MAG TPA: glycosyltransferase family 87 protein [Candidatus Dormibacteraeota bacterium]